ncbi:MAG: glycosyltransferase family 4 protein [Proteobacteria bacterium]|nr:glycosyltransferase family 4 protein [Pseudomonadota bacterium]
MLVGSFKWIAKQENLRQFLEVADPIFAAKGIEFQVVGFMPSDFAASVTRYARATQIVGPVENLQPYFDRARIALVPESIGGGFKLKFLDYIFGRVPVATLTQAAAGLPSEILEAMLCRDSLRDLALGVADLIDRVEDLNAMQEAAFDRAQCMFRWQDRGNALLAAIRERRDD